MLSNIAGGRRLGPAGPGGLRQALAVDDVSTLYALRRRLEIDFTRRSVELHNPASLDRLEAAIDVFASTHVGVAESNSLHTAFYLGLMRPAASAYELRAMADILQNVETHFHLEQTRLDLHPAELPGMAEACHQLLTAYRDGDVAAAVAAKELNLLGSERHALACARQRDPDPHAEWLRWTRIESACAECAGRARSLR